MIYAINRQGIYKFIEEVISQQSCYAAGNNKQLL